MAAAAPSPKAILILAGSRDNLARRASAVLRRRGATVVFLSEELDPRGFEITWAPDRGRGRLRAGGGELDLAAVCGVLARDWTVQPTHPGMSRSDRAYARLELEATLLGLLAGHPARVVNRPDPALDRGTVISQRAIFEAAVESGFRVPPALVTPCAETALAFYERCGRRVVIDGFAGRVLRRALRGESGAARLRRAVEEGPICLQALPEGTAIRALIVGGRMFVATRSSRGAWRESRFSRGLEEACRALADRLSCELLELEVTGSAADGWSLLGSEWRPQVDSYPEGLRREVVEELGDLLLRGGDGPR